MRSARAFNQDISGWDVSSVTTMSAMFRWADVFNNGGQALNWSDTGSVINMSDMFRDADAFNLDISPWDVSSVTNMSGMFSYANIYNNGGVVLDWANTNSLTNISSMFTVTPFNQSLNSWNFTNLTGSGFGYVFSWNTSFNNGGVTPNWNITDKVTNLTQLFNDAYYF